MGTPRIDQVNLVVPDPAATTRFLTDLGVETSAVVPGWEEWAAHHSTVPSAEPFSIDLDSTAFARWWGGLPPGFAGVVVTVRTDGRDEVDRLHARARELGATTLKEPYDAFWGSRYASVEAPGPLFVGLMSPRDPDRNSPPPALTDLT